MNDIQPSTLYIVATPIGNRQDLGPRAQKVLAEADVVAAEDTRVSGAFLRDLGINTALLSVHEHNESQRVPQLLERLRAGASVALISDAGTPLISDPGYVLVRAARQAGFAVLSVPGPCAAIAAMSVSGLPTDRFHFDGFVAAKSAARTRQFERVRALEATLVFYVSKRQLGAALEDACAVFGGDREAAISRELTKLHEQTHSGTLASLAALWPQTEQRGEWVLSIRGAPACAPQQAAIEATVDVLLNKLSTRDAAALTAQLLGVPKREAYAIALARTQARKE